MERSSDHSNLDAALRAMRPTPRPAFAAELDELAAKGFQRDAQANRSSFAGLAERLKGLTPQRLLFTTGGTALATIAIATVIVASTDSGRVSPEQGTTSQTRPAPQEKGGKARPRA